MRRTKQSTHLAHPPLHYAIELLDRQDGGERLEFDIVPDRMADLARGFLGEGTPLAKALAGQPAGAVIPYHQADIVQVRILSITTAASSPVDREPQRQATLRRALEEADRTNAILFASSFTGKWGDYEPDGMENWNLTKKEGDDAPQS